MELFGCRQYRNRHLDMSCNCQTNLQPPHLQYRFLHPSTQKCCLAFQLKITQNTRPVLVYVRQNPILVWLQQRKKMERDYKLECLMTMPRHELEEFSLRVIGRMVPEDVMQELFTFEHEEVDSEDRMKSAQFDAMLRMTAIALGEVKLAFSESENAQQNSERMTRLILWHFYAMSFNLEEAVTLEQHCEQVEKILEKAPTDAFGWVKVLTELLHTYAELSDK